MRYSTDSDGSSLLTGVPPGGNCAVVRLVDASPNWVPTGLVAVAPTAARPSKFGKAKVVLPLPPNWLPRTAPSCGFAATVKVLPSATAHPLGRNWLLEPSGPA